MKKEKFIRAYLNAAPLPLDDISEARRLENQRSAMASQVDFSGTIDNISVATACGTSQVRIYTPAGSGPFAAILYMHGGGFSIGSPDTSDNLCRTLSGAARAVVVSVDYRLAPEHKFPAALDECYELARWIDNNDVALNIRNDQLVIAGDSAGANLATALCLLNGKRQELDIAHQVLICPMLDQLTPQREKIGRMQDPLLTDENCRTFSGYYFADSKDAANPLASPLLADDLSAMPDATIISAGLDPLAAETESYVQRLRQEGTDVYHLHYPDQVHDFPLFIKVLDDARESIHKVAGHLKKSLNAELQRS